MWRCGVTCRWRKLCFRMFSHHFRIIFVSFSYHFRIIFEISFFFFFFFPPDTDHVPRKTLRSTISQTTKYGPWYNIWHISTFSKSNSFSASPRIHLWNEGHRRGCGKSHGVRQGVQVLGAGRTAAPPPGKLAEAVPWGTALSDRVPPRPWKSLDWISQNFGRSVTQSVEIWEFSNSYRNLLEQSSIFREIQIGVHQGRSEQRRIWYKIGNYWKIENEVSMNKIVDEIW